jgi:tetratricopeptide (TPR) repeat protein
MKIKFSSLLSKAIIGLVVLLAGAMVLLVLPVTNNVIFHTKLYTILTAGLLSLLLFTLALLKQKTLKFVSSPFTVSLLVLAGSALLSSLLANPYPVANLLGTGGAIIAMVVFVLFTSPLIDKKYNLEIPLGVIAFLLTLSSLLQAVGYGPSSLINLLPSIQIPNTLAFNLTGSNLIGLEVLILILAFFVAKTRSEKRFSKKSLFFMPAIVVGIALYAWSILPGKPAEMRLVPFTASWSVMLDTVRAPRQALIGTGPESYANAYALFKPSWMNENDAWNTYFNRASNSPLNILSTMGFVGLVAWLLLANQIIKQVKASTPAGKPYIWPLLIGLVLELIFPPNLVLLGLQGVFLTLYIAAERSRFSTIEFRAMAVQIVRSAQSSFGETPTKQKPSYISTYIIAGILLLAVGAGSYFMGRSYMAYARMHDANKALVENDIISAYNLEREAIVLNPFVSEFRRQYALTNLSIAAAISQKAEPTEEDQTQIAELVQQSVREARVSITLDPSNWQNYLNLAQIYQNLISTNEEALQWSIQTYVEAANANPMDPNIRMSLGSIFYGQKQFDQAASLFSQAVNLKPDLPNSHYNLAVSLIELGQLEEAVKEYQSTLSLLDPNSEDYITANKELEELQAKVDEQIANQKAAAGEAQANQAPPNNSLIDQNLLNPDVQTEDSAQTDVDLEPSVVDEGNNTPPPPIPPEEN